MGNPRLIGERIRAARMRLNRNKNQMARELATSWQHVDRWERGLTGPSPESLKRLAAYLGVTVDYLLGAAPAATQAEPEGFESFRRHYAPADITEAEVAWLRSAPFGDRAPTPGEYIDMLHRLRTGAEVGPPASASPPPPRSGARARVDRPDLVERLHKKQGT